MTGSSSSEGTGPSCCWWCGSRDLWFWYVPACLAHQADGKALAVPLLKARWRLDRGYTAPWRKVLNDTTNRSPDAWIIF